MKLEELKKYKKILVLGYGKEGRATEKFLKKYLPDATVGVADKKTDPNYLDEQKNYDLVVRTPGIPRKLVTRRYTTATNIFLANIKNTVIGVTGTKGKSTTASLIYSILTAAGKQVHLVGNIGHPALEKLLEPVEEGDIFVIELSSYQLDDVKYSPSIAVVLDLYPEHMNYHGSIQNYYNAKKNIIAYTSEGGYFIYNPRFEELKNWTKGIKCKTIPFEEKLDIQSRDIPLLGEHNRDNIRAAITVSRLFGVKDETIRRAIKAFKPLPHRLELVGTFKGITFYDDAISTTPESTIFAIKTLKNVGTIFLGGTDRGYQFKDLVKEVLESKIRNVVLFPDSGDKIYQIIKSDCKDSLPRLLKTKSMEEAVKFTYRYTPKGMMCLLSCASPSYSLWKNFEEKGAEFQKTVKKHGLSE